jgi:acetoacetyl-CoA synthetase
MASRKALWINSHSVASNLHAFHLFAKRTGLELKTYDDLHQWSCTHIDEFAWAVWPFCRIRYSVAPTSTGTGLDEMWPPPKWFPGARLNYTENILGHGISALPDAIAVTACQKGLRDVQHLTFPELTDHVAKWTITLRKLGI